MNEPWREYYDPDEDVSDAAVLLDMEPDDLRESRAKDRWVQEAPDVEVLLGTNGVVDVIEDEPRNDHNVWVVTEFESTPSEIEFDDWFTWTMLRRRIQSGLGYEITNTRLRKGKLTVTIRPGDQ